MLGTGARFSHIALTHRQAASVAIAVAVGAAIVDRCERLSGEGTNCPGVVLGSAEEAQKHAVDKVLEERCIAWLAGDE